MLIPSIASTIRAFVLASSGLALVCAQDRPLASIADEPGQAPPSVPKNTPGVSSLSISAYEKPVAAQLQSAVAAEPPPFVPLNLKDKYLDSVAKVVSVPQMTLILIRSGMDQSQIKPRAWGTGADSFGVRVASRLGRSLLRESVAFGIRAVDHEDPRYFPCKDTGTWKRVKYAVSRTVVARNDSGGWMPAYSRILSDYSMPLIAQLWRPEPFKLSRDLRVGSTGMGLGALVNVGLEFWPDVRKRLPAFARKYHVRGETTTTASAKP